jgi:hypothetical protein
MLFCGMAIGDGDRKHKANDFRSPRAPSGSVQGLLIDFFDLEAARSSSRCLRESPIISRQMRSST